MSSKLAIVIIASILFLAGCSTTMLDKKDKVYELSGTQVGYVMKDI
jgi:protein involved in sex pheromone biosynthesis